MRVDQTTGGSSPEYTGRYLVVGRPGQTKEMTASLKRVAGLNLASSLDFEDQAVGAEALSEGDGIYLHEIGVAIVAPGDTDQLSRIAATQGLGVMEDGGSGLEPERVVHATGEAFRDYLRGYRDAVNNVSTSYLDEDAAAAAFEEADFEALASGSTWGLQKTRTVPGMLFVQSATGLGIKVAVLDTGMDLGHPDFAGRSITSRSFVPGEAVQDLNRHGTHCIGTACGSREPADPAIQRYGVATDARIFAGKVLSDAGSGTDGSILGGINWAVAEGCHIVSMSLGALATDAGFSVAYEAAAQAALARGILIVAAAGNDGGRPVSHPANCPSIMAVGAVDEALVKASFSNVTHFPPQGKVDIVGPGVGVFSSIPWTMGRYGTLSGTSMATPHVAGIAALHAQTNPAFRGAALWQRLIATAMPLSAQPAIHVGAGLVQAPFRRLSIQPIPRRWPPIGRPIPFPIERLPMAAAEPDKATRRRTRA